MKKTLFAAVSLAYTATAFAQNTATPTWDLNKDPIDPATIKGKIELVDGVVTLDGQNSFAIPAKTLGAQKDYTIEFELKRAEDAKGTLTVFSNTDAQAKAGIEFRYSPPDYNAINMDVNGNRTVEYRGFLGKDFDKVTVVAQDSKLSIFRNGLILAVTNSVTPSTQPLTFGAVQKIPTTPYQVRNIKIYDTAIFPTGFDASVERMRNFSGDGYFMQRVDIKDPALPRILVIGDSISMGYRLFITEHFKGRAYVDYWVGGSWLDPKLVRGENSPIKRAWSGVLSNGPYDVVTWNPMGLHLWNPQVAARCPVETYVPNITEVVEHIQKVAPKTKFIWISTTPFTTPVEGQPSVIDYQKSERLILFNKQSDEVMAKYGIPVVDLYGLAEKNLDKASKDSVHWNEEASKLMAETIIPVIEARLPKK